MCATTAQRTRPTFNSQVSSAGGCAAAFVVPGKQELESSRELRLAWEKRRNLVWTSLGYLSACLQKNKAVKARLQSWSWSLWLLVVASGPQDFISQLVKEIREKWGFFGRSRYSTCKSLSEPGAGLLLGVAAFSSSGGVAAFSPSARSPQFCLFL